MTKKETSPLILTNKKAGNSSMRSIWERIRPHLGEATFSDISELEKGAIREIPNQIAIVGGDGTIRAAVSWLASHDEYPELFIAGGGSTNTFRIALIKEDAQTQVTCLKNGQKQSISFQPAVIEHEDGQKDFWVISAGFGDFEKDFASAFEKVRKSKIPHGARAHASGVISLIQNFLSAMSSQEPLLHAYVTSQRLGPLKVLRKNQISLSGNNLGLVEVDKKSYYWPFLKGLMASCFWQMNLKAPEHLAKTKVRASFSTEIKGSEESTGVNLDGDEKQVKPGKVNIRRHDQSFSTSALIWTRRSQG